MMSDTVLQALIASAAPTIAAVAALIVSIQNKKIAADTRKEVQAVHTTINSGKTIELKATRELGVLEGKEQERQENKNNV